MSESCAGKAKALVLVHGFLGAANNWLVVVAKLKARPELSGWDIFCSDLRWHAGDAHRFESLGPSELPPSTSAVAKDLARQLSGVDAAEMIVVGHSFGLRPLIKILADELLENKNILALVAEDSTPELSAHGTQLLERVLKQTPVPFADRESARRFFDESYGEASALSRFLLSNIREDIARGGHTWRFPHETLMELLTHSAAESLQEQWIKIKTPVFMIVGDHSEHLSRAHALRWQAMRVDTGHQAELQFVQGAGHWVHSDKADEFVTALVNVLKLFS